MQMLGIFLIKILEIIFKTVMKQASQIKDLVQTSTFADENA